MFFSCLDRNDILDAIKDDKEARKKCGKEIAEFETACSRAWVCVSCFVTCALVFACCWASLRHEIRRPWHFRHLVLNLKLIAYVPMAGQIFQGEARDGV